MKFSSSIDSLQNENRFLRFLSKALLVIVTVQVGLILVLYDKLPILVERSSRGMEIVRPMPLTRNEADMRIAINLMIKARFDSEAKAPELFLSSKQMVLRDTEQKEIKGRSMSQSVVVRHIKITKDDAVVDFDRVISVGEIRSALKTQVKVTFEEQTPNELNPYGLVLSLADPTDRKEERK